MIKVIENKYNGLTIDNTTLPENKEIFEEDVVKLVESIKNKKLLWIKISVEKSNFIPILTKLDFEFHHCDEKNLMLVKKMAKDAIVPTTKNYIVGIGAIVFHEGRLLVIKDKFSRGYKLPGGHIEKNESIKNAVKREVYEETGVIIEFESIMNKGHFRNGQFGESNLYIVCTAKALSKKISIQDTSEIQEALWIETEDFLKSDDVNNYNKSVIEAAIKNKELKLIDRHIKLRVADGEVFF